MEQPQNHIAMTDGFVLLGEPPAETATAEPAGDIPDVTVLYYRSDGRGRMVVPARSLGDGLYEATVKVESMST